MKLIIFHLIYEWEIKLFSAIYESAQIYLMYNETNVIMIYMNVMYYNDIMYYEYMKLMECNNVMNNNDMKCLVLNDTNEWNTYMRTYVEHHHEYIW